jgi:hypothetical protein
MLQPKASPFRAGMDRKAYNADLVGAHNVLITPSPERDRGNGPETRPGIEPSGRGDVIPNPLALEEPSPFRAGRRSASISWGYVWK